MSGLTLVLAGALFVCVGSSGHPFGFYAGAAALALAAALLKGGTKRRKNKMTDSAEK